MFALTASAAVIAGFTRSIKQNILHAHNESSHRIFILNIDSLFDICR